MARRRHGILGAMADPSPLGEFLRARRQRLSPAEVGLPTSSRRRTPGLRREEVAALAGVSIDYLVRLEQGRDTNPSSSVLSGLADALRLDEHERRHLAKLAMSGAREEICDGGPAGLELPAPPLHATTLALLERMGSTPAFVVGPWNSVLAWNQVGEAVAAGLGMLEGDPPNLARWVFTHPAAREVHLEWEAAADEQVRQLRAASGYCRQEGLRELLAELEQTDAFASRWAAHPVADKRRGRKALIHPQLGRLTVDYQVMDMPEDAQRLIAWLPADDETEVAFRRAAHGDGLRLVERPA